MHITIGMVIYVINQVVVSKEDLTVFKILGCQHLNSKVYLEIFKFPMYT